MKTKSSVKCGEYRWNHNQSTNSVKVQSGVKGGTGTGRGNDWLANHNIPMLRAR